MRLIGPIILVVALALTACDDPFAPGDWPADTTTPDTVEVYSIARPELRGMPGAFDFTDSGRRPVVIEDPGATGAWDIALAEEGGQFVFLPPGALGTLAASAGIRLMEDTDFDALEEAPAPGEGVYTDSTSVSVQLGATYVVRTRRVSGFLGSCVYYAKMQPLELDSAEGLLRFRYLASPFCNDRGLVPKTDED